MKKENLKITTPMDVYKWYSERHLQVNSAPAFTPYKFRKKINLFGLKPEKKIGADITSSERKLDRFKKVIELYTVISQKYIDDLKKLYVHDATKFQEVKNRILTRIDNKLRISPEGNTYLVINGNFIFDGSKEKYKELFKSSKTQFRKVLIDISREIISVIRDRSQPENDKTYIISDSIGQVSIPKPKLGFLGVDLDGTIIHGVDDETPIEGAKEALDKLKNDGWDIVIYTARFSVVPPEEYEALKSHISDILNSYEIPFDSIAIVKPSHVKIFIDDRSYHFQNWKDTLTALDQQKTNEKDVVEELQFEDLVPVITKSFETLKFS